jgi:hypothetical protein
MQFKPISERVESAFRDPDGKAFGDRYLDIVLQTWRDVSVALRRTGTALALLIAAFLLLFGAKRSSVSIGPFKVDDLSAVLVLMPALVAHLLYEFVALVIAYATYDQLRLHVVRHLHPAIEHNDLESAIAPGSLSFWGQDPWRLLRRRPPALKPIENGITAAILIAIVLGCAAFVVDAYVRLPARPHVNGVELALSGLFAAFSLARLVLLVVDWWRTA